LYCTVPPIVGTHAHASMVSARRSDGRRTNADSLYSLHQHTRCSFPAWRGQNRRIESVWVLWMTILSTYLYLPK
jgi:hypothetical protein